MNIAVFGYGSLANKLDVERTLGRVVPELQPAILEGWLREWNVVVRNHVRLPHFEILNSARTIPANVVALNVSSTDCKDAFVNGVLFELSETELMDMDLREAHYYRVEITNQLATQHSYDKVYTYTGKPEFLIQGADDAVLPDSYIRVVEQGFASISNEWLAMFEQTTLPPRNLVVRAEYIAH